MGGAGADAIVAGFDASAKPFALDLYITNYEVCVLACARSFPACCAPLMQSSTDGSVRPALDRHALVQLFAAWLTAMQLRRTDQSADGCVRRLKVRLSCFLALALPVRIRSAPKILRSVFACCRRRSSAGVPCPVSRLAAWLAAGVLGCACCACSRGNGDKNLSNVELLHSHMMDGISFMRCASHLIRCYVNFAL